MAIVSRDKHGPYTKSRRAEGPALDRTTLRYVAVVKNVWSKPCRTHAEAQAEERRMKTAAVDNREELGRDRIVLAAFIDRVWLPNLKARVRAGTVDQNSLEYYEGQLASHILPKLGHLKLRDITPTVLQEFYAERAETRGWIGPKSALNLHGTVSNILRLAVDRDYLVKNPASVKGVRPTGRRLVVENPKRQQVALSVEESRALLMATTDVRLAAAWRLLLVGGLRRGELLGLEWTDLDLDAGRVHLQRTWKKLARSHTNVIAVLKTGHARAFTIDPVTVEMLRAHRVRQVQEQLAAPEGMWQETGAVFADEIGRRLDPQTFSRWIKGTLNQVAAKGTLHDLRRTAVTRAIEQGVPVLAAAERFGHSPKVMLDRYAKASRAAADEASVLMASAYDA